MVARRMSGRTHAAAMAAAGDVGPSRDAGAAAGLSVSPLILDFGPGQPSRGDVDVLNTGSERLYVVVEPARIDRPGLAGEHRTLDPDPEALGMLATPQPHDSGARAEKVPAAGGVAAGG